MVSIARQHRLCFAEYVLDRSDERLIGPGGPVRIGNKAFRVLETLAEARGQLLTKDQLFETVWDGTIVSESALSSVIKELRRALRDESKSPRFIESVYGRGYRFLAPVGDDSGGNLSSRERLHADDWSVVPAKPVPAVNEGWRRLRRATRTRRSLAAAVSVAGSAAAIAGLLIQYPSAAITPSPGVELGTITRSSDVPETLPTAIRDATLAALSASGSVPASLPGSANRQPFVLTGAVRGGTDTWKVALNLTSRKSGQVVWSWADESPAGNPNAARDYGSEASGVLRCALNAAATKPDLSERTLALLFQLCGPQPGTRSLARIDLARRVTVADPEFAPGWASLASQLGQSLYDGEAPEPGAARAEGLAAARKAQALDPGWATGWYAMSVLIPLDHFAEREGYIRRALAARPLDCGCMSKVLGDLLAVSGRGRDAEAAYSRGLDHEPGDDGMRFYRARLQLTRDPENSQGLAWLAHPEDPIAGAFAIGFLRIENELNRHRFAQALAALPAFERAARGRNTASTRAAVLALVDGSAGSKEKAAALLLDGIADPDKRGPIDVQLLGALGDHRGALAMAKAIFSTSHDRGLAPLFSRMADGARRLPDFAPFADQAGLLRYWREGHIIPDFCREAGPPPVCSAI